MSEKIFTDAAQSAVIKFRDETPEIPALTLQEAVIAFAKLPQEKVALAYIETADGASFTADEVDRLYRR